MILYYTIECRAAVDRLSGIDEQCTTICECCLESDYECPESLSLLREICNCPSDSLEPCTAECVATHAVTYTPATPSCSNTTTVTEYLSIKPTNCLQSTPTKEMSTTVRRGNTERVIGDPNSPVILGAFTAVLAALLVAVTTGWIVTCVVNRRKDKDKASTTRY